MTAKRLIQNLTLFVVAIGFFACSTGEPSISRIPASIDYSAPLEFGMSFDASVSAEPSVTKGFLPFSSTPLTPTTTDC